MSMYYVGYIDDQGIVRDKNEKFIIRLDPWNLFEENGIILLYDKYDHNIGMINHREIILDKYGKIATFDDFHGKLLDMKGRHLLTVDIDDFTIQSKEDLMAWYKSLVPIRR